MKQRVRVTWRCDEGHVNVEDCVLISEDESIVNHDGESLNAVMKKLMRSGYVIFEELDGDIFCLRPERIVAVLPCG